MAGDCYLMDDDHFDGQTQPFRTECGTTDQLPFWGGGAAMGAIKRCGFCCDLPKILIAAQPVNRVPPRIPPDTGVGSLAMLAK